MGKPTNETPRTPITNSMEQANKSTSVANRLLIPDHRLTHPLALICALLGIFLHAVCFVGLADWEDEQEGIRWAWYEGQQVRVFDAEDVMEGQSCRKTELLNQRAHYLGVVLLIAVSRWWVGTGGGGEGKPRGTKLFLFAGTSGSLSASDILSICLDAEDTSQLCSSSLNKVYSVCF